MHVSWLLMRRSRYTGHTGKVDNVRMEPTVWCTVPTNAFECNTVTHLIITKQALPVPHDMSDIVEVMESWGSVDVEWYNRVVDYLGYLCSNGFHLSREDLAHHSIELRVDLMARRASAEVPLSVVMDTFDVFFAQMYKYQTKRFFSLCQLVFEHVRSVWLRSLSILC